MPLIGLTLRSILLPHRSLHSTHVLPLIPHCCTPSPSPTTSKETPHILPKMLSCTFTFPFHSRGHANVLHCGKTAVSGWRNGPVIKVTFSLTPPPLQDPFLPHPPLLLVLFVERAMNVCFKEPCRMPRHGRVFTSSLLRPCCRGTEFCLIIPGTDTCWGSLFDFGRNYKPPIPK